MSVCDSFFVIRMSFFFFVYGSFFVYLQTEKILFVIIFNLYMNMKKTVLLAVLMLSALMVAPSAKAQVVTDTMDVPFGKFESWVSYPADSLSLMGGLINLPVNYDYQLPEGWSVPRYNLDDTLDYSGMSFPVSLSLPVAVVYPDTLYAPEGNKGVVARTFRFQDVVTPSAYSMASGMLDSTLTSMILPSVLVTGEINLDSLIPLISRLTINTSDMSWLLTMVDSVDLNNYIAGGFPLNGFKPGRMIGKYIYRDPGEGDDDDNAVVVMLGTRYDTLQHRRLLVGAGVKRLYELYDTSHYELFEFDYTSLSSYFPDSYGYYEADSMVVLVVSSASDKGFQYGSRIYLDQLRLVSQPTPCGRIVNLHEEENIPMYLHIAWNNTATPDRWEVEYGQAGFVRGRGTTVVVTDSNAYFSSLSLNTRYDFYVHGLCGDTAETEWVYLSVLTDSLPSQQGINGVYGESVKVYPNPAKDRCMVDLEGVKASLLRLYTIEGRVAKEMDVKGEEQVELLLPGEGIFILEVMTAEGNVYKRVIGK